jgi:GTP-binding protein
LRRLGLVDEEQPLAISAATSQNLRQLLYRAAERLKDAPPLEDIDLMPVYRLESDPRQFTILKEDDGWRVSGEAIERAAAMTYWEFDDSIRRFQRILHTLGIEDELRKMGAQEGDTVYIGDFELEWQD